MEEKMMLNVIVYGLGKYYEKVCKNVETNYHVIGHCDREVKFSEIYPDYVAPSELCNIEYDYIMVTSIIYYREIVNDLIEKYGINHDKILIWIEEERKRDYFNGRGIQYVFGQFGEDYVIAEILKEKKIPREAATYIEIGVDNPFSGDHTYFLHLVGARGILVDANPESINLIKVVRKNQKVINKVVSNKRERVPFYIASNSAFSSLNSKFINMQQYTVKREIMIDSILINDVLAMQDKTIVLSIDVEGHDEIVLRDIDFSKYQPEIICAEVQKPSDDLVTYMEIQGYELVFCNYVNAIWKLSGLNIAEKGCCKS